MALNYEKKYYDQGFSFVVGIDEAGRGPLLGPVVACALILPKDFSSDLIDDSKKLSQKKKEQAYKLLIANALDYGIGIVSSQEIDELNIYQASRLAMIKALKALKHHYEVILTDAMSIPFENVSFEALIKGDQKAQCIAGASIIAKVTRDRLMEELDAQYPLYGIKSHKGYPTRKHLKALKEFGPIKGVHRYTYRPVKKVLKK
ncbi:MAG: ribonuclease HII [Bacilli bacterium]|jgi:ribonuclease HII